MTTFFSAIQGKFKAGYHGRYMGHIIEQIAAFRPEITRPILAKAPLQIKHLPRSLEQIVSTETSYLLDEIFQPTSSNQGIGKGDDVQIDNDDAKDRQSDIEITLTGDRYLARVIVEIKMLDKFHKNQLKDYIRWVRRRHELEDRAVVVLTAYPLDPESQEIIKQNSDVICHMYLSDLVQSIDASICDSELVTLFKNYLSEEGYAMYQLQTEKDESDYKALHSYMVLSFLRHASGHGKVSTAKNIARGPVVFSSIIQNWQLVSNRLANELGFNRIPTVRYYPQQAAKDSTLDIDLPKDKILELRQNARNSKNWGRYWLCSECVCSDESLRLEWGQILQIQSGSDSDDDVAIKCSIFAFIKKDGEQISEAKLISLTDGIKNPQLYSPESFMKLLRQCVDSATKTAIKKHPDVENKLPWL